MEFGLAPERVWISVYEHDSEALAIWRDEIGVPMERIQRLGDKDNFWAAGPTGRKLKIAEALKLFTDEEAAKLWKDEVGVDPRRIHFLGDKDNFWAAGPTGPCGPCSELYYDFHPERGTANATVEDDSRFIEFYNLVRVLSRSLLCCSSHPVAGVYGEQPLAGRHADSAGEQEHRHGYGPGAHGANPAARAQQLRDRPHPAHRAARRPGA